MGQLTVDEMILRGNPDLGTYMWNNLIKYSTKMIEGLFPRLGQVFDLSVISRKKGIKIEILLDWLSSLESDLIVYTLSSYSYSNSKLYFQDTGVLCRLLGIQDVEQLRKHPQYGSIFENFVINKVRMCLYEHNPLDHPKLYFLRDKQGPEVDLVIPKKAHRQLIEIKCSTDYRSGMDKGLKYFSREGDENIIVYQGTKVCEFSGMKLMPIKDFLKYCYQSFS